MVRLSRARMYTIRLEGDSNMADVKVLALVGSLRAASINRQLAELAAETAPDGRARCTVFDGLGDLPFYNEDIDNDERGRRPCRRRCARPPPTPTRPWSSPRSTTAAFPAC